MGQYFLIYNVTRNVFVEPYNVKIWKKDNIESFECLSKQMDWNFMDIIISLGDYGTVVCYHKGETYENEKIMELDNDIITKIWKWNTNKENNIFEEESNRFENFTRLIDCNSPKIFKQQYDNDKKVFSINEKFL